MDILHRWSSLLAVFIGLCLFLLLVVMPASAADNTEPGCSITSIQTTFSARYPGAVGTKPEQDINEIQTLLKKAGYDPGKIDGWLGRRIDGDTYKALEQFCSASKDEVRSMQLEQINKASSANDLANILVEILTRITDQPPTRVDDRPPYLQKLMTHVDAQPKEIKLSGGGCGCSRDFKEHAQVYGFYPHWLADGKKHIVDFSLFDRIGYFALTLNEQGHIERKLHFPTDASSDPNIASFIKEANIHRVAVDVTFVASSWQDWNVDQINNAVDNIVGTVTRRYEVEEPTWWRKLLPLVENFSTSNADGINLFFDLYEKPEQGKLLTKIVKAVRLKLKQANSEARLNIMLGFDLAKLDRKVLNDDDKSQSAQRVGKNYNTISSQFRQLEKRFKALKEILVTEVDMVDNVFIFLSQNTRQSKKDLRQLIENAFVGESRRTVMRKMVPIVSVQGLASLKTADGGPKPEEKDGQLSDDEAPGDKDNQFDDDLIYMQDNFAGIGLWRLPLLEKPKAKANGKAEVAGAEESGGQKDVSEQDKAGKDQKELAPPGKTAKTEAKKKLAEARASVEDEIALQEAAGKEVEKKVAELETAAEVVRILGVNTEDDTGEFKNEEERDKAVKKVKEIDSAKTAVKQAKKALEAAKINVESANTAVEKANSDLQLARTETKVVADKVAMQDDVEALREALKKHFQPKSEFQPGGQFAFLGEKFEDVKFKLCEWACPNRWVFRIAIDVLIVLALLYWLWALVDCRLREFYQRRFLWFTGYGVMIAMVFAVSAACDPSLKDNALKVMFGISLLIPVSWGISRIRKMNQPLLP